MINYPTISPTLPCKRTTNSHRKTIDIDLGLPRVSRKSPLDYFFYHNRYPSLVNCSEHVDRGVLIVVCLTNVPGLEVLRSCQGSCAEFCIHHFVCPEVLVHNSNLYQEAQDSCSNLVCIMAGDQLAPLLKTRMGTRDERTMNDDFANLPMACVHRVRSHLKRTRLSISYELRL
jgi:hypothetical protein